MDVRQYLEIFAHEAAEHVQNLSAHAAALENEPEDRGVINEIFCGARSLKGMAGTMGFRRMQNLTGSMENVFRQVRDGRIKVTGPVIDILFQCLDAVEGYLHTITETSGEGTNDNEAVLAALAGILESAAAPEAQEEEAAGERQKDAGPDAGPRRKFLEVSLPDSSREAMRLAEAGGRNVYGFTVYLQNECLLKAARAFLVFQAAGNYADIFAYSPSLQDIGEEKFDLDFSFYAASDSGEEVLDEILAAARAMPEVEAVAGEQIKCGAWAPAVREEGGEMPAAPAEAAGREAGGRTAGEAPPAGTVPVEAERLAELMNQAGELINAKNSLAAACLGNGAAAEDGAGEEAGAAGNSPVFHGRLQELERAAAGLYASVRKVCMVSVDSVASGFPLMVRGLSHRLGRKIELSVSGGHTELERVTAGRTGTLLAELLENLAVHSLEEGGLRLERGKPEAGSLYLNAYQEGSNVIFEAGDDGSGIDPEILDKTVRPKIRALGGGVQVISRAGEGSRVIVNLPLKLAVMQVLLIEVNGELYGAALSSVVTIEEMPSSAVRYGKKGETVVFRGREVPLIRLNELLDIGSPEEKPENLTAVIVSRAGKQAALAVDNLLGQRQIVPKPLSRLIRRSELISGAAVLGDGRIALILDVNTLL